MKVLLVVIAVIALIWLCVMAFLKYVDHFSPKTKSTSHEISSEKTHTKDDHDHKPAAQSGKHEPHHASGPSAIQLAFAVLIVAVAFCLVLVIYRHESLGAIPKTRGQAQRELVSSAPSASSYSASVIPPGACTIVPEDARKVVAPVDGCSEPIVVDRGTFLCTDPDPSSGLVRAKNWYGQSEPTDWSSGSAKGDHACMGTVSGVDSTTPTAPRTVHVWLEKYQ